MSFWEIVTVIIMWGCCGIFTWQFWLLLIIEARQKDNQEYQKLAQIPLSVFLFFWPISILLILRVLYLNKQK